MRKGLLLIAILLAGGQTLIACGDDESPTITLRALNPRIIDVPEGTDWNVELVLNTTPSLDEFVDIDYARHSEFLGFTTDKVKFTPYDDPPKKSVTLKALKVSGSERMDVVFKVRSSESVQTLKVRVIAP